ncbi:phosphoribosyltransferase family protein [Undibacterium sp. Ren11W]|uniref:phosphoribosyltransferase family protein n=1 Tax=Undibacterium sp. Ren11W TaxID=3413045 RepID=UPI003BF12D0A
MPSYKHYLLRGLNIGLASLLPSSCPLCGTSGNELLCRDCRHQFFKQNQSRCRQCAIPLLAHDAQHICGECLSLTPAYDSTLVAGDYAAPIDQMVLALKFGQKLALATLFADLLRDALLQDPKLPLAELLCPVPLGRRRLQERGYNQSLEIAKPLSAHLGISLAPLMLIRSRETVQQSSLHPDARQKNVHKAFALNADFIDKVKGKHIGVIDDVMTTGTTLNEIAQLLKRFGAAQVSNYVFARTPRH